LNIGVILGRGASLPPFRRSPFRAALLTFEWTEGLPALRPCALLGELVTGETPA
jgi:hypothetical protein